MSQPKTLTDTQLAQIVGGFDAGKAVAAQQATVAAQQNKTYGQVYKAIGMCPCGQNHG